MENTKQKENKIKYLSQVVEVVSLIESMFRKKFFEQNGVSSMGIWNVYDHGNASNKIGIIFYDMNGSIISQSNCEYINPELIEGMKKIKIGFNNLSSLESKFINDNLLNGGIIDVKLENDLGDNLLNILLTKDLKIMHSLIDLEDNLPINIEINKKMKV